MLGPENRRIFNAGKNLKEKILYFSILSERQIVCKCDGFSPVKINFLKAKTALCAWLKYLYEMDKQVF